MRTMFKWTLIYGDLLIMLGIFGYLAGVMEIEGLRASWTALIPAFVGIPIVVLAVLSLKESRRKHTMHAAAALGLLAALAGLGRGLPAAIRWLTGTVPASRFAVVAQLIMGALSLVYVVLCFMSFRAAAEARRNATAI